MLINYLPEQLHNSKTVQEFQGALNTSNDELNLAQRDLLNQLFVDTATWGLVRWEKYVGLQTDLNKDYEFRRSRIKSKLRGSGTTTKQMIKNVAESFSNGEVDILEDFGNYLVKIKFVGSIGIPPNVNDLADTIEEIKPAHLAYEFIYVYNTNINLSKFTHAQLSKYTHQQLRESEVK